MFLRVCLYPGDDVERPRLKLRMVTQALPPSGGSKSSLSLSRVGRQEWHGIPSDGARDVPNLSLNASASHDSVFGVHTDDPRTRIRPEHLHFKLHHSFRCSDSGYDDDQGLVAYGGTSADAPSFPSLFALIEQQLECPRVWAASILRSTR